MKGRGNKWQVFKRDRAFRRHRAYLYGEAKRVEMAVLASAAEAYATLVLQQNQRIRELEAKAGVRRAATPAVGSDGQPKPVTDDRPKGMVGVTQRLLEKAGVSG